MSDDKPAQITDLDQFKPKQLKLIHSILLGMKKTRWKSTPPGMTPRQAEQSLFLLEKKLKKLKKEEEQDGTD